MKRWGVVAVCVLVGAVALWLTLFRASDEDKVKTVLSDFAKIVAVKDGDTILSRTARLRSKLEGVVEDDVLVTVPELHVDVRGRRKLEDDAARAGALYQSAHVEIVTQTLTIDPAGTVATVDATALVTAVRGGDRRIDRRDVHFVLRKDGGWKISTLDVSPARE